MADSQREILQKRLEDKLSRECGEVVLSALANPKVVEIMLNPDGRIWLDVMGEGMHFTGTKMSPANAESLLATCASMLNASITYDNPVLEGEFPLDGSRLEGLIAPVVRAPTFTIRKKASQIFTLDRYAETGVLGTFNNGRDPRSSKHIKPATLQQYSQAIDAIRAAIRQRKNILIVGGTGSGKTTLANAILAEIAVLAGSDRLIAIEDTMELQLNIPNHVLLRASTAVSMQRLLRATMRLRPDRIVVGEVRGGEALTLLKSWNTGHPGGVATIHANSAMAGLTRLRQLIYEAPEANNLSEETVGGMIAEAIDLVLFIERTPDAPGRRVSEVLQIVGYQQNEFQCAENTNIEK